MPTQKAKKPAKKPSKPVTGKKSAKVLSVKQPAGPAQLQYQTFEKAIQLLQKKHYREAKEMFEKARHGPSLEISSNAQLHVRMCDRRMASPAPGPKSAEEHYNYGVALINLRNLDEARKHLATALELDPRGDHIHYAFGVCLALSGDAPGAYDSLKRAIDLQPRNRMVARQDSDLDAISNQPRFSRLLYPERNP